MTSATKVDQCGCCFPDSVHSIGSFHRAGAGVHVDRRAGDKPGNIRAQQEGHRGELLRVGIVGS
jgi:hypothetical protein